MLSGPVARAAFLSGVGDEFTGSFRGLGRPAGVLACGRVLMWGLRLADGTPRVMSDLCVHRGTALSLGRVSGDELVCAYHGWRYGADGRCTAIPQKEDPAVVPAKARVAAYRARERYGLIWVALEEPRW